MNGIVNLPSMACVTVGELKKLPFCSSVANIDKLNKRKYAPVLRVVEKIKEFLLDGEICLGKHLDEIFTCVDENFLSSDEQRVMKKYFKRFVNYYDSMDYHQVMGVNMPFKLNLNYNFSRAEITSIVGKVDVLVRKGFEYEAIVIVPFMDSFDMQESSYMIELVAARLGIMNRVPGSMKVSLWSIETFEDIKSVSLLPFRAYSRCFDEFSADNLLSMFDLHIDNIAKNSSCNTCAHSILCNSVERCDDLFSADNIDVSRFTNIFESLTDNCCIIGLPGSGKTTALAYRIKESVASGISSKDIVIITKTTAETVMLKELLSSLNVHIEGMRIYSISGVAFELLKEAALLLNTRPKLFSKTAACNLIKKAIYSIGCFSFDCRVESLVEVIYSIIEVVCLEGEDLLYPMSIAFEVEPNFMKEVYSSYCEMLRLECRYFEHELIPVIRSLKCHGIVEGFFNNAFLFVDDVSLFDDEELDLLRLISTNVACICATSSAEHKCFFEGRTVFLSGSSRPVVKYVDLFTKDNVAGLLECGYSLSDISIVSRSYNSLKSFCDSFPYGIQKYERITQSAFFNVLYHSLSLFFNGLKDDISLYFLSRYLGYDICIYPNVSVVDSLKVRGVSDFGIYGVGDSLLESSVRKVLDLIINANNLSELFYSIADIFNISDERFVVAFLKFCDDQCIVSVEKLFDFMKDMLLYNDDFSLFVARDNALSAFCPNEVFKHCKLLVVDLDSFSDIDISLLSNAINRASKVLVVSANRPLWFSNCFMRKELF